MARAKAAPAAPAPAAGEPAEPDASQLEDPDGNLPAADSSPASLTGSSVASDLLSDPGPEFDPDQAADHARERDGDRQFGVAPGGDTGLVIEWDPAVVRGLLEAGGSAAHGLAGKAEADWLFTKTELSAIAGPLTRILNRYDATRVAAGSGDELAVLLGLCGYVMRSVQERKAALDAIQAAEEHPSSAAAMFGVEQPPPNPGEIL